MKVLNMNGSRWDMAELWRVVALFVIFVLGWPVVQDLVRVCGLD